MSSHFGSRLVDTWPWGSFVQLLFSSENIYYCVFCYSCEPVSGCSLKSDQYHAYSSRVPQSDMEYKFKVGVVGVGLVGYYLVLFNPWHAGKLSDRAEGCCAACCEKYCRCSPWTQCLCWGMQTVLKIDLHSVTELFPLQS